MYVRKKSSVLQLIMLENYVNVSTNEEKNRNPDVNHTNNLAGVPAPFFPLSYGSLGLIENIEAFGFVFQRIYVLSKVIEYSRL